MILIIIWFICGFIAYGLNVAYFQGEFKLSAISDRLFSFFFSFSGGPASLLVTLVGVFIYSRFKYGFKL